MQIQEKIPLLGDALVIAGTVCYAFSNVGEVSYGLYVCCYQQYLTIFLRSTCIPCMHRNTASKRKTSKLKL